MSVNMGMVSALLLLCTLSWRVNGERLYGDSKYHPNGPQAMQRAKSSYELFRFVRLVKGSYFLYTTKQMAPKTSVESGTLTTPPPVIPQQCAPGYSPFMGLCAKFSPEDDSDLRAPCPTGYVRSQRRCLIWGRVTCPEGYAASRDMCHLTGSSSDVVDPGAMTVSMCPEGYEMTGNTCYECCRKGYTRYYSNLCISKKTQCSPGFRAVGKNCMLEKCPSNMVAVSSNCEVSCNRGFLRSKQICHSTDLPCPSNYKSGPGNTCELESCPAGQILLNGEGCVAADFLKCPSGFENHDSICRRCKTNATQCSDYDITCPRGWRFLSKEKCVIVCPEGTAAFGLYCVSLKLTGCPEGYVHLKDHGCIRGESCPKGYELQDKECIPKKNDGKCAKYTLNGKCMDKCPAGFVEHDHSCVLITSGKCTDGFIQLAGEFCVAECPEDYIAVGGQCVSKTYCSENLNNLAGKCLDNCPSGYVANNETRECLVDRNFCKTGTALEGGSCVSEESCKANDKTVDSYFKMCLKTTQCSGGKYYFGKYCLSQCPVGYETYIGTCKKMSSSVCAFGVYHKGMCVPQCPEGFVPKMGVCVDVPVKAVSECGINMTPIECGTDTNCTRKCMCKEGFIVRPGKNYCIPKEPKCPNKHALDVVFVIDGSDDVTEQEFNLMKLFVLEALTHMYSANADIRVGLVIFGPSKQHIIYLYVYDKECDIIQYFTGLQMTGGSGSTLMDGLRVARELVFTQCNGARIGVARQLYVLPLSVKFTPYLVKEVSDEISLHQAMGHRVAFITVGEVHGLPANVYNLNVEHIGVLSRYAYKLAEIACNDYVCPTGYKREGDMCVDDDECQGTPCHPNSKCYNQPGSFKCYCSPGLKYVDNKAGCTNSSVGDCKLKPSNVCDVVQCVGGANCSSSNGMGFCVCPRGFNYDAEKGCVDHNECSLNPCLDKATCRNSHGSFDCICPKGYQYDKHFGCIDRNECVTLTSPCSGNGECRNTLGSYECICRAGYEYVKDTGCIDIDECKVSQPCKGMNVQCRNTNGSFQCNCEKGFQYGPDGCKDIDECTILADRACGKGAVCVNTEPGYNCSCAKGFIYDNAARECTIDESKNLKQRKADLVFVVDSSNNMREALFPSVISMVVNIIKDYRNQSSSVKKLYFGMEMGGNSTTNIVFEGTNGQEAEDKTADFKHLGGTASLLKGLTDARRLYSEKGQQNATKMVFVVTATKLPTDQSQLALIKAETDAIKSEGRLIIIHVGSDHKKTDWLAIFTEEEIEKYVIVVAEAFIKTVHSLIYQKSDTLIACPEGFIFLDNVCQYRTHNAKYCKFDDNLYAINSTWVSQCALMQCTESEGVKVLNTKCMGYDGDCYEVGDFFPCNIKGELQWQCRCQIQSYMEQTTGQYQQQIKYTLISFDRKAMINDTRTDDGGVCDFPFKYNAKWYYACTNERSSGRWCSHYHTYDSRYYSYCKSTVIQQCVVGGKVYQEGEKWSHGCNEIMCSSGRLSITTRCETAEKKCVQYLSEDYPCVVNDKEYSECICTMDSYGYGKNSVVSGSYTGDKEKHTSETVQYCEQRTTGKRHEIGSEWLQDCFKLKCNDGNTEVTEKNCMAQDNSCHSPGTSGFPCVIKGETRGNCTCEVDGNNLIVTAYSNGKEIREETKGSVVIAGFGSSSKSKSVALIESGSAK